MLKGGGATASLKLFEDVGFGYEWEYNGSEDKLHLWSRLFSGNEGIRMTWIKTGNVGIGTTTPTHLLEVNGTAAKPGGGSWTATSDSRLKQEVRPYTDGLEKLLSIKPVTYRYNELAETDTEIEYVGVIAQELKEVAPYMVGSFELNGTEYLDVDNSAMTYMLINAMKEQQQQIEELKSVQAENEGLRERLERMEAMIQQFGSTCCNGASNKLESPFQTDEASLKQNIPNPFSGSTIIPYYIPQHAQHASLHFFNETGIEITQRAIQGTGEGQILFTGEQLPAGIYFYRLQVDGRNIATKRMVVLR